MYAWNSKNGKVMTGVTYHREILTNQGIGTGKTACGAKTDASTVEANLVRYAAYNQWTACRKCFKS